jgi:tetratricopeptide (TPR) repeat protein
MMFEELHALDYALYAYLQTAQDAKARDVLTRVEAVKETYPVIDFAAAYAWGAMPARYALERRAWKEAAALQPRPMPFSGSMPFSEGHVAYARAVGAAKSGDLSTARAAAERLRELSAASREPRRQYFADQMEIQRQAALGLIAVVEGRKDEGLTVLRTAADREDSLGKHPVSPGAMFPVRELLAEALLDNGKAAEARIEFEAVLKLNPGRFNGVYGAARAAALDGKRDAARRHYEELVALASVSAPGEQGRPELAEAKKYMASTADNH